MKRIRFTEEQIIAVVREQEAGVKAGDLARVTRARNTTSLGRKVRMMPSNRVGI
jgi:hypothetical protein